MSLLAGIAHAGGPRFITGTASQEVPPGQVITFYTSQLTYFTDPGNLSMNVTHAAADAMVAAAAAPWNIAVSSITLTQGGQLAEHVNSANAYFYNGAMVFPPDVDASNYLKVPIAILYDTDGSITDLLLGEGASNPIGCRQNAVTESVDSISGTSILHAVIILNGRCVGSTAQQLTQMQYQLERAFGRVLGISWSQTNDNVFTGSPQPSGTQMAHWPIMHPIDVLCSQYTYQCIVNPFTLREDDISTLVNLYPVSPSSIPSAKSDSWTNEFDVTGRVSFPTGQGMSMVNASEIKLYQDWQSVSGISGMQFQQDGGNPVTGGPNEAQNVGRNYGELEGFFWWLRMAPDPNYYTVWFTTEAINPLYIGEAAIGPYVRPPVTPSGIPILQQQWMSPPSIPLFDELFQRSNAASVCNSGGDGSSSAPAQVDATGWWQAQFCGDVVAAWRSLTVRAGRSWTIETTALDEAGNVTLYKAQPVIGVWNATDAANTPPTVAATPAPMNAMAVGVTQLRVEAATADTTLRFVLADQFGSGRPDFNYTARVLYADSVSPATVGAGGGQITITGMGFRKGNSVTVNGVPAPVTSWTASTIVATAPSFAAAGKPSGAVSVAVADASTGATTSLASAITYTTAGNILQIVTAPAALENGITSPTPFAVRLLASDGIAPVVGASIGFAASPAIALGCGSTCTLTTDATGLAQTTVTATAAGSITLIATEVASGQTVQTNIVATDPVRSAAFLTQDVYLAAGASASWIPTAQFLQDGTPASGTAVTWTATSSFRLSAPQLLTGSNGQASVAAAANGQGTLTACAWTSVCASWHVIEVDPSLWSVAVTSGAGQSVSQTASLAPVGVQITDGQGHALAAAPVMIHQTVYAWEGACTPQGRCPAAPVLATSTTMASADNNGNASFTPLQVSGVPQEVSITLTTGISGATSLTLIKTP